MHSSTMEELERDETAIFPFNPKGIVPHLYSECTGVEEILPLLSATLWWDFPQTKKSAYG